MSATSKRRIQEPREDYFPLRGGLDLNTPPYQVDSGRMLDCLRYEVAPSGGYKPIDGFERIDGRGVPSLARFQYLILAESAAVIANGAKVTGSISSAVGVGIVETIVRFPESGEVLDLTGSAVLRLLSDKSFESGEELQIDGVTVATVTEAYDQNTEYNSVHELHYHWLAVESLRKEVVKVPGSGPIRGVWRFNGTVYAWRDDAEAISCVMYREDPEAGWAVVDTPDLLPGGKYLFENTNFGGSASTVMMYGVDGKNKGFQFDGAVYTQITTGMVNDAPILLIEHAKHLFFGFPNGSLQHSPPTQPTGPWSVVINAGELGMGEELVDIKSLPGGVLGIFCKDSISLLYGTGVGSWQLVSHSKESGAIAGTVQHAGRTIYLNRTGIADLSATNAFGDFKEGTLSWPIHPLLKKLKSLAVCSVVIPEKNQYRIFFSNNQFITATFLGGKGPSFSLGEYPVPVLTVAAARRADDEVGEVYFGSEDGYVYKMDSGVSLDHEPMRAYVRLHYAHQRDPRRKKRYRGLVIELDSDGSKKVNLRFFADFSFVSTDTPVSPLTDLSTPSGGNPGIWNVSNWNQFSWDTGSGTGGGGLGKGRMDGVSTEVGLVLFFDADNTVTPLHTLNGVFVQFNYLGLSR